MSGIFEQYYQADTRLHQAQRQWEEATEEWIEDCADFGAADVAASALEAGLGAKRDTQTRMQHAEELLAAQTHRQQTAAAVAGSEHHVETAEKAIAAAKATLKMLEPLFHQWLEDQWKREEVSLEEAQKRYEEDFTRFTEGEESYPYDETYTKTGESFADEYYTTGDPREDLPPWEWPEPPNQPTGAQGGGPSSSSEEAYTQGGTYTEESYTAGGAERPREEEANRPHPSESTQPARSITVKEIQEWHQACVTAFLDKPNLRAFPQPPAEPCTNESCASENGCALKACKCNLRKIFSGPRSLKQDRLKFHPDRFASCPEDVRDEIQQKAKEVFVVVDAMFR
ncbi:hypothetical protein LTR36_000611 [Oleoguttula mirabilis]|uniref:Uncharacterized protein n=1 Tax=Oleoguttula mirabilis TaxID=1507867 RepID=A0AAV9JRP2_9PEZI|nr:hypothetical protein LTR36_000611 [Oleoguttula mirabilis]